MKFPICSALLLFGSYTSAWQDQCQSFNPSVEGIELVQATYYSANALVNITNLASSISTTQLPAFCRLQLIVTTSSESYANTELWLPDSWNGRTLTAGNGGWHGGVTVADLGYLGVLRGFAAISTNTGHNSTSLDASWALNNPNAIIDNAYRALHLSVVYSKEIVKQYYGKASTLNVYSSCSTGGRQGLLSAQRYPDDFDGIVVGSPANWITHLQPWSLHIGDLIRPNTSERWISASEWANVNVFILHTCDELDGVKDGVINDPTVCLKALDFDQLTCKAKRQSGCLTSAQVAALKLVYVDYYEGENFIFNSMNPGSELVFQVLLGPSPSPIAVTFFQNMIYNDTTWDPDTYDYSSVQLADRIDPGTINAINPNLDAFKSKGGKVIHYVGLIDALISPGNSYRYRNSVSDNYGGEIDDFYRFYPIPGMGHCSGGPGASNFGLAGQQASGWPPLSNTAEHDATAAMVQWLEQGKAPESFVAVKYVNDTAPNVAFTRPICRYPTKIVYNGGDDTQASSYSCK